MGFGSREGTATRQCTPSIDQEPKDSPKLLGSWELFPSVREEWEQVAEERDLKVTQANKGIVLIIMINQCRGHCHTQGKGKEWSVSWASKLRFRCTDCFPWHTVMKPWHRLHGIKQCDLEALETAPYSPMSLTAVFGTLRWHNHTIALI